MAITRSEYQRRFAVGDCNVRRENYEDMLEFRRQKKSRELRHTPLLWLDESTESSYHNSISINKEDKENNKSILLNDKSICSPPVDRKTTSLPSKAVQTTPEVVVSHRDVGVQSPRRSTRFTPKKYSPKKLHKKSIALNHDKPVIAYGWADKTSNCWRKRTFNVKAPSSEVRQSALRAAKQRDCNLKKRLTRKERLQNEKLKKEVLLDSLTNFNQWQTEYQKSFCK